MPRKENVSHHPPAVGAQRQGFQPKDNLEIAVKDFPQASMALSGTQHLRRYLRWVWEEEVQLVSKWMNSLA